VTDDPDRVAEAVRRYNTPAEGAEDAGAAQADIYDREGVDGATVLVLDWAGGNDVTQFHDAQSNTGLTGDSLGGLLDHLGTADPAATINLTAHSMGNDVVLHGLAGADRLPATTDVDYLAIQPAVDADFAEQSRYDGALPRVDTLDMTVNPHDSALGHYEAFYGDGDPALGDETPVDARRMLRAAGAPVDTEVHSHDEDHAGLDPSAFEVVRELVTERADDQAAEQGAGVG
jgi:esterase/lipase superfamily enzyme